MNALCPEIGAESKNVIGMILLYTIDEILSKKCIITFLGEQRFVKRRVTDCNYGSVTNANMIRNKSVTDP